MLAPELNPEGAAVAEFSPESAFEIGLALPQSSCCRNILLFAHDPILLRTIKIAKAELVRRPPSPPAPLPPEGGRGVIAIGLGLVRVLGSVGSLRWMRRRSPSRRWRS